MLPTGDGPFLQILDAAFADAARRSGEWLVCKPGCTQCCVGVFAIDPLDAARLQQGLRELAASQPERAQAVLARARSSAERLRPHFPGVDAPAFEDFANDEPCPVLDPATGLCDLYAHRPVTCRVFGPPVRSDQGLAVCELCYHGASDEQIAACEMNVEAEGRQEPLLLELEHSAGPQQPTLVAFALAPPEYNQ